MGDEIMTLYGEMCFFFVGSVFYSVRSRLVQ